jgi:predicted nucleic acid-binding protein
MPSKSFVDTNILVYAHDSGGGLKHELARSLVTRLWEERSGVISTQVVQEFYVNVRRKALRPVSQAEAKQLVQDYLCWQVVVNDGGSVVRAIECEDRFGLSFWDALIVQAASSGGCETLFSEDLNHGQRYGNVRTINPFLS